MTPTSPPSYDFLEESSNIIYNIIRSSPATVTNDTPMSLPVHADILTHGPTVTAPNTIRDGTGERLNLNVSTISPLSKSYVDAFNDPNWQNVMHDEYNALIKNNTWTLVPRPAEANIVHCMWLFRHKHLADGTLSCYKARLVTNGSTQLSGVDVDERFIIEIDYMHQPPGFQDYTHPDYVCLLQRSLYGLKQWSHTTYLLLYVDDIVLTTSSETLFQQIIASLHQEFSMTDLDSFNYFIGISITRDSSRMFLSQHKYAVEILERANMVNCNPSRTSFVTVSKLGDHGDPVSQVCLYMHDHRESHFLALKHILRYVRGTLDFGLQLFSSSTASLVAYSYAGCASFPTTRRSTSGYIVFLDNNLLYWSSKRQPTLSRSSAETEYRGVANAVADIFTKWLPSSLFEEFRTSLSVRCPSAPTAEEC
ncbi:ribonuclease H-like domain-containing protein [Tanacetum coccineum]